MFTACEISKNFFADSIAEENRGTTVSVKDMFGSKVGRTLIGNANVHDSNFAFLTTTLAKLHTKLYEPKYWTTYGQDIPVDVGGGFVDYVTYYTVDWAGIMSEFRNVVSNNANYIPRVNAGLNQEKVNVYTFEVAYDLRFVELEKMKKITLQKSIQDIYQNAIVAGWDLFVQKIAYTGAEGKTGLFNSTKITPNQITNKSTGNYFEGMTDEEIVAFFNSVFETYLTESNMNISVMPDTFLVPVEVGKQLSSRFSSLYTSTLRRFITEHNLGTEESGEDRKITIQSRPDLDNLGTGSHGRIVAYKKDKDFVRLDMPYPMQHFVTLPNIDKMSYTSAFVGQVSEIQLPYNTGDGLGAVTYWDFAH